MCCCGGAHLSSLQGERLSAAAGDVRRCRSDSGTQLPVLHELQGRKRDRRDGGTCGGEQFLESSGESADDPGHTCFFPGSGDHHKVHISGIAHGIYGISH